MSEIASEMEANALEAMKFTRKLFVVELDFSEASLQQLEALFDDVDFTLPGGKTDENIQLLRRTWGSYLGEVIRRSLGGQWMEPSDDSNNPTLVVNRQQVFPLEIVERRLQNTSSESIWTWYQSMRDAT